MPSLHEASPAEIDVFLKAASQRYTELGIEPARAQQLLAATLVKLAGESGVLKQAVPVITPAANAISSGAQNAGEAWDALPDPVRTGLINALIGGGLVGGGTAAMNYMGSGEVNKDQVLRNAALGAAGGALTPAISSLLQGVLGKMGSAELVMLAEGILKHSQTMKRAAKPAPLSKKAQAFVAKVRQLLKHTNAG
jgi:hypothetical protein